MRLGEHLLVSAFKDLLAIRTLQLSKQLKLLDSLSCSKHLSLFPGNELYLQVWSLQASDS